MVLLTLSLLAFSPVLLTQPAQDRTYSIQGAVTFEGGFTYQQILVHLEPFGSRPIDEVYADVSGNFTFRNVTAGTYYVRVTQPGFEEFAQRIEVPEYSREVTIFLQRKASAPTDEIELGGRFKVDLRQLSIPEKAIREYHKALDDAKQGKTSRAIERLRQALSIAPNFIEAAFHLGSTLYKIGHFDDAEKTLAGALAVEPKEPHLHLMLANVLIKERKYQQATSEIEAYLKQNPDGAERAFAEVTRSQLVHAMQSRSKTAGRQR